jgi:integrase
MSGHIRRRGKNSWALKFELETNPLTGKRRIRYATFRGSKREAQIELARLIAQHAAGEGIDPSKATVAEFFARWEGWASANVSPKTFERYRQIIRLNIIPYLGNLRIQKLRAVHLVELYSKLQQSGGHGGRTLSARSVGHVHRILHRALGHAATWGVIAQNVAALTSPPPVPNTEISIVSEEQIRTILKHLEGRTIRPIVSFLLGTGARRGEALALRWKDLDLDRGTARIEQALEQTKAGLRFKAPKTRNGRRTISLSPWLVSELRAHNWSSGSP